MATVAASTLRTVAVALGGTPTALVPPAALGQILEIRAIGSAAWTLRQAAADAGYPVAAGTEVVIPVARANQVLAAGSGTLSLVYFGNA